MEMPTASSVLHAWMQEFKEQTGAFPNIESDMYKGFVEGLIYYNRALNNALVEQVTTHQAEQFTSTYYQAIPTAPEVYTTVSEGFTSKEEAYASTPEFDNSVLIEELPGNDGFPLVIAQWTNVGGWQWVTIDYPGKDPNAIVKKLLIGHEK